ncbi:oligopeptide ABC transporter substrate-binding protein OppA [Zooshikella marina]|uniref:Oligopeptide ABC transporter substrate-binding protein OppA n=1 Tax=Zooshikella ganghwensis TaxID=202772 RepID=A0A4P9VRH8_9GAMM|nr:ABC transporter substrate-binding protein [Zooshikella ganghwensis]MBU2707211.1 oligopeptide ABC transporter substrate-binding protein OppA [Zooshikella ganghwensis]RDH45646.1 oligopeptide ABC transporter substrate-binding protein OppA [Zooshikella ganghwensis]
MILKKISRAVCMSFLCVGIAAQAAVVPEGVKLDEEQRLVRGNGSEPASIDPQKIEGTPGSAIARDLFEGLVSNAQDGSVIPGVAESWDVSEDKMVYTFKLRQDARWSNGDPVTAEDFVYAFQRGVDPKLASNYAWYFELAAIKNAGAIINGKEDKSKLGVKAVDDHTFQVTLEKPLPYFVKMMVHTTTYPVPKKVIEKLGDQWTRPGKMVSNGAFKLKSWVVNEKIVVERNPNYWNNKQTVLNEVVFLPIQERNAELDRYRANEVHLTYERLPIEQFKRIKKDMADELHITGQASTYYYSFYTRKKPFDNVKVRKALSLAIDRSIITDKILGMGQIPTFNLTPANIDGFKAPENKIAKLSQKERNEMAKKLLAEAGYSKDKPLSFTLLYNTDDNHKKIAVAIASMWKKTLGAKVSLENQEWKTYLDNKRLGNFEVARAGWNGDYNEASTMLDLMTSKNTLNDPKYNNPEYDQLLVSAIKAENPGEFYMKAEQLLARDMPIAPIYHDVTARLVKPFVGGYQNQDPLNNIYSKDYYIIKH